MSSHLNAVLILRPTLREDRRVSKPPSRPPVTTSQVPAPLERPVGWARWWTALTAMTVAEIREDRDLTPIGFLKWMLDPISYMVTYVVLVQVILDRGTAAYPLFVLCAVLPWQLFQAVATGSLTLVSRFSGVIGNRVFPRTILPLSVLLKEGATLCLGLSLFAPLMFIYDVRPTLALLWLPVILAVLGLLSLGPAYLAAVFGLYFPDFRIVVTNMMRIVFLASTALVPMRNIPGDNLRRLILLNPFSEIFTIMRQVVIQGRPPRLLFVVYPAVVGVLLLAVGLFVYRRFEPQFAKEL